METTKSIQQLLFRAIDSMDRDSLGDPATVRDFLTRTALEHTPFLYSTVCAQIEMLVSEYST
jgi:hypothetical protein